MRSIRELLNIPSSREKTTSVICSAISTRCIIVFFYHGGYRTVEPFCLGLVLSGRADNESLLCYQIGGYSELSEAIGWKLYRTSEMESIEITRRQFSGNRPGYDPDNIDMATIYCRVLPVDEVKSRTGEVSIQDTSVVTHNKLMKRFRFKHSDIISEPYTNILSSL